VRLVVDKRPPMPEYFMRIALEVRERANCVGNKVGAVLVREERIISTGYNGVPEKVENCLEGGCEHCARRSEFGSGKGYDLCICVHAEENALLTAARFGIQVEGAEMYTTLQPCFNCLKEMVQVRIAAMCYLHQWPPPEPVFQRQYDVLQSRIRDGVKHLTIPDPKADWAVSKRALEVNPLTGRCPRRIQGRSHPSTSPGAAWRSRNFREGAFMSPTLS
jgi:dCMP deaminase